MTIVKIGSIELTEQDARKIYESDRRYLITYSKIYELRFTPNTGYHGRQVLSGHPGLALRGRFHRLNAAEVNALIGWNLLNTRTPEQEGFP